MYLTCADTVRFMSESCPLASLRAAVARMVTIELPSRRRKPPPGRTRGPSAPMRSGCQRRDPRWRSSIWMPSGVHADRRQDRGVGGIGIHLALEPNTDRQSTSPLRRMQPGFAGAGFALGGDIGAVKSSGVMPLTDSNSSISCRDAPAGGKRRSWNVGNCRRGAPPRRASIPC